MESLIGNKFSVVEVEVISTDACQELSDGLLCISKDLNFLINKYKPDAIAIEFVSTLM